MSDLSPPSPPSPSLSERRRHEQEHHDGDDDTHAHHHDDDEHHVSYADEGPRAHAPQPAGVHNNRARSSTPPHRHTATGAYKATSPGQGAANSKERSLMELLAKAASEIRVERRKVRQLLDENEKLRGEVTSLKGKHAQQVRQQQTQAQSKEMSELKGKYTDLLTAHKAMSVELEQCKEQLQTWQHRYKEQQRVLQTQGAAPRSRAESPTTMPTYADRHGGRSASATGGGATRQQPAAFARAESHTARPQHQHQQQQRSSVSTAATSRHTQQHRSSSAPRPAPFDAMASQGLARSPPRLVGTAAVIAHGGHASMQSSNKSAAAAARRPSPQPQQARKAAPVHEDPAATEAKLAAEERHFNDLMLSRLRRAIAPPPTKEQLAEVVHAMVVELVKSAARNGLRLELKRVGPSVYQCGRRKLHLTVDSRRLVVKCGGGHVDMNEFVQRNHLWTPMDE